MKDAAAPAALREGLCAMLPRLRRFARTLTGDAADADDVVQLALEKALARAGQWQPAQGLDGWVFGIVRNAWLDELRSRQRGQRLFAPAEHGEHVGTSPIEAQETALAVQAAIATLPEEQRSAVVLVLAEGLSYREAALALDIPVGTLTSRLARARDVLQGLLRGTVEEPR